MTLDDFQSRLRAIYDGVLARAAESKRQCDAELDALWRDAGDVPDDQAPAFGAILNAELLRVAELTRAAQEAG